MKKSKHFRKDVILARVIAGVVLIVVMALLISVVSLLTKESGQDKDSQNTPNTQQSQNVLPQKPDTEEVDDTEDLVSEEQSESTEVESETDSQPEEEHKIYVKTTTQVKLRAEANTNCATLDRINGGTTLEVLEVLDGWYKVTYDGKVGYVSADYAKVVEE